MRTLPARLVPVVLLVLASASSGCRRAQERAEEQAIEQQTGGQVHLNSDKGTMTITTDAGTLMAGVGSKIPDDFPKTIPVYPGAKADLAAKSASASGKDAWTVTLESPDPKDKVVAYYKANMPAFKMASDMNMGQTDMTVWQGTQYDVTLMISEAGAGKTTIAISAAGK